MTKLCVFCGSSVGRPDTFARSANALGSAMASRGIDLVYGGGSIGLMGVVADAVLTGGGQATGIITEALAGHEIAHQSLSNLEIVSTMHERKARMAELSDGFVMLPGGVGTYEEFFEAVTWAQLRIHDKPCGVLNVDHFFDDLLRFLDGAVDSGFIKEERIRQLTVTDDVAFLLNALESTLSAQSPG
jgi:hypothetical protein